MTVLIVGGNLSEHLLEPPPKAQRVQPTRRRATVIINPPTARARGLLAPKTELLAPAGHSVGIDCPGRPRRTPHGSSPASAWGAADEEMRNSSPTARKSVPGDGCLDGYAWKTRIFVHASSCSPLLLLLLLLLPSFRFWLPMSFDKSIAR